MNRATFTRFKYHGEPFVVWEPYGDSSRYWIGPDQNDPAKIVDVGPLEGAIARHRPVGAILAFVAVLIGILWAATRKLWA